MTESVKTKTSSASSEMSEMEFKFSKFSLISSKALCLGVCEPTKRFAAQSTASFCHTDKKKNIYFLRVWFCVTGKVNRHFSVKMKKYLYV